MGWPPIPDWSANDVGTAPFDVSDEMIVSKAARSPNFQTGVAGWKIDGDGTAEFQDATIRGTLNADDIVSGTLDALNLIADLALTLDMLSDPVHSGGANDSSTNDSLTTTPTKVASATITIPTWVGSIDILVVGTAQLTNSSGATQSIAVSARVAGTSTGAMQGTDCANGEITSVVHVRHRTIVAPGASVEVAAYTYTTVGTNSVNFSAIDAMVTGVR